LAAPSATAALTGMLEREYAAAHPARKSDFSSPPVGLEELSNTHGVTQIVIERTACYGRCPVYSAVIESDGRISYAGGPDAPRRGRHSGMVYPSGFTYLARLANELGIHESDDNYSIAVTDNPTVYLGITRQGRKKIIRHYAPSMSGPARLMAFENEVDRVVASAEWK
jgi:hypothetical protein